MMNLSKLPKLQIGQLEAKLPIVQGGMGVRVSLSKLASAVAEVGGIGVISAAAIGLGITKDRKEIPEANKQALTDEIRASRKLTKGVIGVNIMVALSDYLELLEVAYREAVDIVFCGAGLPLKLPKSITRDQLVNGPTRFAPIVSSGKAARVICKYWERNYNHVPDAIVLEGPDAGGHLGFSKDQTEDEKFSLSALLPDVVKVAKEYGEKFMKKIPVIAGGGIYTGNDIYDIMKQGADAVQMGTRFVATDECDASEKFKQTYVDCKQEDIGIIKSPVGLPGRAIIGSFLKRVEDGFRDKCGCPFRCLKSCNIKEAAFCIAKALNHAQLGEMDDGFAFVGTNGWRIESIMTVKELVESLVEEFNQSVEKFGPLPQ